MATRTLLCLSRALGQPIRSISLIQSVGGSTCHTKPQLPCFLINREFSLRQVLASTSTQTVGTKVQPKELKDKDDVIEDLQNVIRSTEFKQTETVDPAELKHFKQPPALPVQEVTDPTMVQRDPDSLDTSMGQHAMPHPIWTDADVQDVIITHRKPEGFIDTAAFYTVKILRGSYDIASGYHRKTRSENLWLNRIIMLETVAGVPGMVAAMVRHLQSLRKMSRDHGWIHTLLEEAENERMHLMVAMQLKQPGVIFRTLVMGAQGMFVTLFSFAYLISPRYCHRFVGYLEEEAVVTYTKCLRDIDGGYLKHWQTQLAPNVAVRYWSLLPAATMRDVVLAIRADEAHHRVVNHKLASMKPGEFNPYKPGE